LGLALSVLSKARKRHVHDAGCHVTCTLDGFLYGNQRVRREAVKHLVTAAELDPSNSRVFKDLAALYEEAGMPRKAEYYMDRAMVLGEVSAQYDQRSREAR
jgi:Flp pilus assembly protein TadD